MFRFINNLAICFLPVVLAGCANITEFLERMQIPPEQRVDEFAQRSQHFKPEYRLKAPAREELAEHEKRLVGAPPPPKGVVLLDGTRYFSANGHVCQLFKDNRYKGSTTASPKSACYINGRWVLAAPVLNTPVSRP